jgi:acyl-CoA synthetase (AMP-forming)/AMP-acid ligase II
MTSGGAVGRLFAAFASQSSKPFLLLEEGTLSGSSSRTLSFANVDLLSRSYAAKLGDLGIRRGDSVAVFAESSPEVLAALLAHLRLGVVHVPINTRYRAEEATHILHDSGAKVLLFDETCEKTLTEIPGDQVPALRHRLSIGGSVAAATSPSSLSKQGSFLSSFSSDLSDSDTAVLVYTSGTTGKSKGVELSYRALVENTLAITGLWRFSGSDVLSLSLPLFHVHGLCLGVFGALLHGMTIRLHTRFDAARTVRDFEEGATVFMGVPTMYVRLLELLAAKPEAAEALSRARLFTAGSAPLPADDFRAFRDLTGHDILERYGMSETLFTLSNPYDGERRPGTVGFPVPGCEVRVVDDDGKDVPADELGEIVVKSNGLMTAYRGRPAETAASFRDGWFLTGDVARRDTDGRVTIVGRKSVDVIKCGGFKISAREIEDCLRRHPGVKDAAVLGAPDRVFGQKIVAAVVLREPPAEGTTGDFLESEYIEFVSEHLADYKRPRRVIFVDELPRNAMGKVQKAKLLQLFESEEHE